MHRAARAVVAVLLLAAVAQALVGNLSVTEDRRKFIEIESFGFFEGGKLQLNVTVPEATLSQPSGLLFDSSLRIDTVEVTPGNACLFLTGKESLPAGVDIIKLDNAFTIINKTPQNGFIHVFFANCGNQSTTFNIVMRMWNMRGTFASFLSAGDHRLIPMQATLSGVWFLVLCFWIFLSVKRRPASNRVHVLMGVLIALKIFSLVFEAIELAYQEVHGSRGGWAVPYFGFLVAQGMMFFILVVLIGSGWLFLKPFLSTKDKYIILIIVPLQIIDNVALIFVEGANPGTADWTTWKDVLRAFDIICCAAVIVPIIWSIRHLRESSRTDGKAAQSLDRLQKFREFYLIVIAYMYFRVILLFLLGLALPYSWSWVANMSEELVALFFYCYVGWKFRPVSEASQPVVIEYEEGLARTGDEESIADPTTPASSKKQQEMSLLTKVQRQDE